MKFIKITLAALLCAAALCSCAFHFDPSDLEKLDEKLEEAGKKIEEKVEEKLKDNLPGGIVSSEKAIPDGFTSKTEHSYPDGSGVISYAKYGYEDDIAIKKTELYKTVSDDDKKELRGRFDDFDDKWHERFKGTDDLAYFDFDVDDVTKDDLFLIRGEDDDEYSVFFFDTDTNTLFVIEYKD